MTPSLVNQLWSRSPRWARDAVGTAMARRAGERVPPPPTPGDREIRLMIAPANFAGQGDAWARAVERNPRIAATSMVAGTANPFGFAVDYAVPSRVASHSRAWQRAQLQALTARYTHLLIEAEMRPLGGMFGGDVVAQARAIDAGGVKIAMLCHGTDIRLPSRHMENEQWSPYGRGWPDLDKVEAGVKVNAEVLRQLGHRVFVATPGLLLDVPHATVLPIVIDPDPWAADPQPLLERDRPKVIHIPSSARSKGTADIEPTLRRLDADGVIEYQSVSGVAHADMPALYRGADIVMDRFLDGEYAVASCEAMSAGRIVLAHVSDQVRGATRDMAGADLPIVEATIENLETVIRDVISRRDHYRGIAAQGLGFVRTLHDGDYSRRMLESWLLDS